MRTREIIELAELMPLASWEVVDVADVIDCYDQEVVLASELNGHTLSATGMRSCGELVAIYHSSIEVEI